MILQAGPVPTFAELDEDVALMMRARSGCEEAFTELVARHRRWVMSVVGRVSRQPELAEDLAQEVFLRVHRARHTYQPTSQFRAWLNKIAFNVARNAIRARACRPEVTFTVLEGQKSTATPVDPVERTTQRTNPLEQLVLSEEVGQTRLALRRISERQCQALTLFAEQEKSYVDVASEMQITTTAVRSLLARARDSLKSELAWLDSESN
ncbi:MAG: sigma-70 family RNA polymerase sigma factor [Planctomycetales bacterium]